MRCRESAEIVLNVSETQLHVTKFHYLGVDAESAECTEAEVNHRVGKRTKLSGSLKGSEREEFLVGDINRNV